MKNLLVVGGSGQLGRKLIKTFKVTTPKWNVMNIDYRSNSQADINYIINNSLKKEEISEIHKNDFFKSNKLDCVVNVGGGWLGGGLDSESVIENLDAMMQMNLNSSVLAANLAKRFLNTHALLVLTGAYSVKSGMNPGMIAYHLSKRSVHELAELIIESKEMPLNTKVITILPTVIDTESNRAAMPDANFEDWTKPEKIAELIKSWADLKDYPKESFFKV